MFNSLRKFLVILLVSASVSLAATVPVLNAALDHPETNSTTKSETTYQNLDIDGVNVFYREAGPKNAPTIVLLHGFPTSSHMFRNLIPKLAERYHVIAPDYPGYGNSDAPSHDEFEYSFDNLANVVDRLLESKNIE